MASKQRRQHKQRQQHLRIQRQQQQQGQALTSAGTQTESAGSATGDQQADSLRNQLKQALNAGSNSQNAQQGQPTPVLSIKEALAARQRLMASRWGKNKK